MTDIQKEFLEHAQQAREFKAVKGHALCSSFYLTTLIQLKDDTLADILWRGYQSALDKTHQTSNKNLFINSFNSPFYKEIVESKHHIPIIFIHGASLRYLCEHRLPFGSATHYQRLTLYYGSTLKRLLTQYAIDRNVDPKTHLSLLKDTMTTFPLQAKMNLNNSEYTNTINYITSQVPGGFSSLTPLNIANLVRNVCVKHYNDIKESDPNSRKGGIVQRAYISEKVMELLDIEFDSAPWWPGLRLYASNFSKDAYEFLTDIPAMEDMCRPLNTAPCHELPTLE